MAAALASWRPTRVLFVRHGKQVSSGDRRTERDRWDPPLSAEGQHQAELLAGHLAKTQFSGCGLCVVSSPMRRALMTAAPCAAALGTRILCHGGLYEYGCAGSSQPGSTPSELLAEFPGLLLDFAGFSATGHWDYQGSEAKESEPEARARAARFVQWLHELSQPGAVVIVYAHQTYLDLVLRVLLEPAPSDGGGAGGGAAKWRYGSTIHKFRHTAVAELQFQASTGAADETGGEWQLVRGNDAQHLTQPT